MTKRAQLVDGTTLEFPDETPDAVMDRVVKSHITGAPPGPSSSDVADEFAQGKAHTLIPGAENAPPPVKDGPSAIAGIPGAITTMVRGIPGMAAGGATAAIRELTARLFGADPQQARLEGQEAGSAVSAPIVGEPSAQAGAALDNFSRAFDATKLAGLNPTSPVSNAGAASTRAVAGANAIADAQEVARAVKRAALTPEALAEIDAVKRAQAQGYKALPVQTNPSAINHVLESVGGKVKTEQNISLKNQPVTNRLAKEGAGVSAGEAATPEELAAIRKEQGKHYDAARGAGVIPLDDPYLADTEALSSRSKNASKSFPGLAKDDTATLVEGLQNPALEVDGKKAIDANHAIDMIGMLRDQADSLWSSNKTLAKANRKAANALEGLIERHISDPTNGVDPSVVENFRNARTKIAKTYDVESAVNPATMNVSARALARRKNLTGELKDAADFARTQEKAVQRPETIGGVPAGSIFDAALTSLLHGAKGVASLGIRPAARAITASAPYQKMFVQPQDYANSGLIERLARSVAGDRPAGTRLTNPADWPAEFQPAPGNSLNYERTAIPRAAEERHSSGTAGNEVPFERSGTVTPSNTGTSSNAGPTRPYSGRPENLISEIADRLQLAESPPKKFGNEIDPTEFLRSLRIGKGEAVDEAVVDRALQAEALKKRFPPASVMNDFQWLMKDK